MFDLPMASVHAFILTVYSVVAPDYNSAALRDGWSWICCGEQVHADPELVQRRLVSIVCHIRK